MASLPSRESGWFGARLSAPGIPRSHRYARSRPLTLREGGGRPQGACLRLGDGVVLVIFGGGGAAHYVADAGHEFGHLHG